MKLLLVTRGFPPRGRWGSEGYAHDLARGLVARGHEVDVFFSSLGRRERWSPRVVEVEPGLRLVELEQWTGYAKAFGASWKDARQDRALAAHLEGAGPFDGVLFTTLGGGVSLGLVGVARARARRVVVTLTDFLLHCHRGQLLTNTYEDCTLGPEPSRCARCIVEPTPYESRPGFARLRAKLASLPLGGLAGLPTPAALGKRTRSVRGVIEAVDLFLAPSPGLRDRMLQLGVLKGKLRDLPYALDPARYAGYARRPSTGPLRLAFLGQIAPHKGLHVLIAALAALDEPARRSLRLVVHGEATGRNGAVYEAELRRQAQGLPVDFAGPFPPDQVARVLGEVDVVVVPSLWTENLPLVVLHALACKVPILASRVAGIEPFIGAGAVLVPPRAVAAWKDALLRIATQPDHVEALRRGAAAAAPPMSFTDHLDAIETLFRSDRG